MTGTSPPRGEDGEERPLMLTNGGFGDEPRRLGMPSARSAPRTAGAKLRNQRGGGTGSNVRGNQAMHGLPRPSKANAQRGEGNVLLGRIE